MSSYSSSVASTSRSSSSSSDSGTDHPAAGLSVSSSMIAGIKRECYDSWESSDWYKRGYADEPRSAFDTGIDELERVDADIGIKKFRRRYMKKNLPVMIQGLADEWPAMKKWTLKKLLRQYGDKKFDVGNTTHTYMTLRDYLAYCADQKDDSPLYLFEPRFADHFPELKDDYDVPRFFPDDYFEYLGKSRPYYNWILIGPRRSGTGIHTDPNETSAWNTLILGRKRWCLFPPEVSEDVVEYQGTGKDNAINWFAEVYPKVNKKKKKLGMIECVQQAGETIYVPRGWWHVVINLEYTISVTANFAGRYNFTKVFADFKDEKPKLAKKWYKNLPRDLRDEVSFSDYSDISCPTSSSSSSRSSADDPARSSKQRMGGGRMGGSKGKKGKKGKGKGKKGKGKSKKGKKSRRRRSSNSGGSEQSGDSRRSRRRRRR